MSVRKSEASFLLKRARSFLENAKHLMEKGVYDLAAFSLEQSLQLMLKYKLLVEVGDYPRTYSLRRLFRILAETTGDSRIEKFFKENIDVIGNRESAYIAARYLPVEFEAEEASHMLTLVEDFLKLLEELGDE